MIETRALVLSDQFTREAQRLALAAPHLEITEQLAKRMMRHGRELEINEEELLRGLQDIEVEVPTAVVFDSHPKDAENLHPHISLSKHHGRAEWSAIIQINPDINAEEAAAGATRDINSALWGGILATEALNQGNADDMESQRKKILKTPVRELVLPVVEAVGFEEVLELCEDVSVVEAIPAGVTVQFATIAFLKWRRHHKARANFDDFVLKGFEEHASALAQKYSVVDEGFVLV